MGCGQGAVRGADLSSSPPLPPTASFLISCLLPFLLPSLLPPHCYSLIVLFFLFLPATFLYPFSFSSTPPLSPTLHPPLSSSSFPRCFPFLNSPPFLACFLSSSPSTSPYCILLPVPYHPPFSAPSSFPSFLLHLLLALRPGNANKQLY